jgi:response regulator RpfG family c-di-GMP phosphodiesterase
MGLEGSESTLVAELELEDIRRILVQLAHRLAVVEGRDLRDAIVIYDPDAFSVQLLCRLLLRFLGESYDIVIAENDAQVLSTVALRVTALLITSLPTGWRLIDAVERVSPLTEVLVATSTQAGEDRATFKHDGRQYGVDYYLERPFEADHVRLQLRQALMRSRL